MVTMERSRVKYGYVWQAKSELRPVSLLDASTGSDIMKNPQHAAPKCALGLALLLFSVAVSAADHGVEKQTFAVPMRDGVKLGTDVYFPSTNGAFPVLLARTPYNKAISAGAGEDGARHG